MRSVWPATAKCIAPPFVPDSEVEMVAPLSTYTIESLPSILEKPPVPATALDPLT